MQEYSPRPQTDSADSEIEFLESTPTVAELRPKPVVLHSDGSYFWKTVWLLTPVFCLIIAIFLGPTIVEKYHHAAERGRQEAKYEVAKEALRVAGSSKSPLKSLSIYYQMVSEAIGPSVVHIKTLIQAPKRRPLDEQQDRFDFYQNFESQGQGSGVIVADEGYIVTNYHVVKASNDIRVTLSTDEEVAAELIGFDEPTDIAVLKIEASDLISAEWADSDTVSVGSLVWAVGSPFGLKQSVTTGVLSAKHRNTGHPYQDFLQTDAAVNPGNSGGPLVDERGRVVGINTAIVGKSYQGICFAIPSNVARQVYEQIRSKGKVSRGWLGIRMDPVTPERAEQIGMVGLKGVVVTDMLERLPSPARQAGVRVGDIVVKWNDQEIDNPTTLLRAVALTDVGSEANVVLIRDGGRMELTVAVGERPPEVQ